MYLEDGHGLPNSNYSTFILKFPQMMHSGIVFERLPCRSLCYESDDDKIAVRGPFMFSYILGAVISSSYHVLTTYWKYRQ